MKHCLLDKYILCVCIQSPEYCMYKIQVVLVPPSAVTRQNLAISARIHPFQGHDSVNNLAPKPFSSLQKQFSDVNFNSSLQNNAHNGREERSGVSYGPANLKKFLIFTKPETSLLDLSAEILKKCEKLYPGVGDDVEIVNLQNGANCDLDPDYLVKDVFDIDNTVRVILSNEVDFDTAKPLYKSSKRQKVIAGSNQVTVTYSQPQTQLQTQPQSVVLRKRAISEQNGGVINVVKKRQKSLIKTSVANNAMRISTPLAHQIYPPPPHRSNNSDDEDEVGDKYFLPPPNQPQSPPIRISSNIDAKYKHIKSTIDDDTVSRSEVVDPDKTRQQRMLSGTPMISVQTPNRVTLSGQRVVSERGYKNLDFRPSIFASSNNRSASAAAKIPDTNSTNKILSLSPRITSGMLTIPEPKILEAEKELQQGPSSPSALLPEKNDKNPMKTPYVANEKLKFLGATAKNTNDQNKQKYPGNPGLKRQQSIANDNGSPVRSSPNERDRNQINTIDNILMENQNFKLADLPNSRRESTIVKKVNQKDTAPLPSNQAVPVEMNNFSTEESTKENTEQHLTTDSAVPERTSFQKGEILSMVKGDQLDMSPYFERKSNKGRKPYTTVLYKDIDNSKPDPRNILPSRTPRNAAKRAAQKISNKTAGTSTVESTVNASNKSEESESDSVDPETDTSSDESLELTVDNNVDTDSMIQDLKAAVITSNKIDDAPKNNGISNQKSDSDSELDNRNLKIKNVVEQSNVVRKNNNNEATKLPLSQATSKVTKAVRGPTYLSSDDDAESKDKPISSASSSSGTIKSTSETPSTNNSSSVKSTSSVVKKPLVVVIPTPSMKSIPTENPKNQSSPKILPNTQSAPKMSASTPLAPNPKTKINTAKISSTSTSSSEQSSDSDSSSDDSTGDDDRIISIKHFEK